MPRRVEELREEVANQLRLFPDWPKKGILFRDIMPLMKQPKLVDELCQAFAERARPAGVEAVAGLEARGFLLGPLIAVHLGVPFIPVRKSGKLPGPTHRSVYVKEYGEDAVEIQSDALDHPKQKVLIVDDLLATGGTLRAAIELIRAAGGVVEQAVVLVELADLNGRSVLPEDTDLFSLLIY